jgi:benzoyl-CoA reductase/2-hydroxyglutaryl-CoA dehydratase subunit BcrC/BadD/HgdB
MSMLETYFAQLEEGLEKKLEQKMTARRKFIYEISKIGGRMFDTHWSSAWTTVFVPFEILNAMGVTGNFIEFVGAMLSGAGISRPYFEKAEAAGYSTDGCSYHRTIIGAALEGILPEPDLLIGASFPCDGGVKALKRVGEILKKDVFVINTPYEYTPESLDYLVVQFKAMIDFIKEKTGRDLDFDLLRQSIRNNNKAREYLVEALELCKNVPSPARSDDLKNFIMYVLLAGSEAQVEVAKVYRDEFKEKVDKGIPSLPNEKYRLLWIQNRIQFKNNLVKILETKFGANVVFDELNYIYWEPMDEDGDPLRALALRQITHPIIGNVDRRLDVLSMLAREYQCHGAINPAHWGCRQSGGARYMFKEALQKVDVPVIHLDVDCVDERNFSEGQLMTRLEAFMEML